MKRAKIEEEEEEEEKNKIQVEFAEREALACLDKYLELMVRQNGLNRMRSRGTSETLPTRV